MPRIRTTTRPSRRKLTSSLMVHLDAESKAFLSEAARLRRMSVSDYVREVTVAQARREVVAARAQNIALSPEEQLTFWNALQETRRLTPAQRKLGAMMQGRR